MGNCYATGHGVKQDTEVSIKWYKKAAENGKAVLHYCKYVNDEGLFVVEGNGTLRAEVFYEDGSCDIIAKEIIAR